MDTCSSLKEKPRKAKEVGNIGSIERDAVPVIENSAAVADLSSVVIRDVSGGHDLESSSYDSGSVYPSSTNNAINTINVHNEDQRFSMQFSNVHSVHLGSTFNINSGVVSSMDAYKKSKKFKSKPSFSKKTRSIETMMHSKAEPTHRILDTIATHLGKGYRKVMRALGYSNGQISQSELDNHMHGTKEVILCMLY